MAQREGFEPPRLTTVDFKSTALPGYAISATILPMNFSL